ncbi:MAG: CoA pyrophosphatase [bacterium]|nr:CoA pyrophosphatase [bacterium]
MKLLELQQALEERLKYGLPGEEAHLKMAPKSIEGSRLRFTQNEKTRAGGVMIMLYEQNGEVFFPLIQRPNYDGVHGGQVSFPGGKREENDTDTFHTAVRETEEEIGVPARQIEIIGSLTEFFVGASNNLVLPVIGTSNDQPTFIPDQHEVSEVVEAKVTELLDDSLVKEKVITVAGGQVQLNSPYFDIQNKVVWGATAMMLSEFKDILKEIHGY